MDAPVCVFCKTRLVEPRWRPFCSERCRLQDLARWVDGTYRVPNEMTGSQEQSKNDNS